jgi:phage shock protein PspC (stress-responsive transcriptional regulator)
MRARGPLAHAEAMTTNTMNSDTMNTDAANSASSTTTEPVPDSRPVPERPMLRRSYTDRMLGGVAGGLGHYFGVDPVIVRIAFAIATLVGGAGIPLYLAGLLLIPEEGSSQSIAGSFIESLQSRPR